MLAETVDGGQSRGVPNWPWWNQTFLVIGINTVFWIAVTLATPPDSDEVLERFYLREEPRVAIRESMKLTELQFNQVLWRARQRFAEILRKQGFSGSGGHDAHPMDG